MQEANPLIPAHNTLSTAKLTNMTLFYAPIAGRMQDNEPLMRALSSLIVTNEPDLVLFVGEALVGNDAVDQLSKFKVGCCQECAAVLSWHK